MASIVAVIAVGRLIDVPDLPSRSEAIHLAAAALAALVAVVAIRMLVRLHRNEPPPVLNRKIPLARVVGETDEGSVVTYALPRHTPRRPLMATIILALGAAGGVVVTLIGVLICVVLIGERTMKCMLVGFALATAVSGFVTCRCASALRRPGPS